MLPRVYSYAYLSFQVLLAEASEQHHHFDNDKRIFNLNMEHGTWNSNISHLCVKLFHRITSRYDCAIHTNTHMPRAQMRHIGVA